jgi:hypothetical protein
MFLKSVGKAYTTIILIISLFILSYITIKFFIPKTIWMANNFPYPTEYYRPETIYRIIKWTIFILIIFLVYFKLIINKLSKIQTVLICSGFLLFILLSEILVTSIAFNPVIGDYAVIKQGIVSIFNDDGKFLEMNQLQAYPYNTHIVLIGGFVAKIIDSVDLSIKILPILLITGSIVFNSLILMKVTNFKSAHISIMLAALNIMIYWQAPIFYTHTLVVFFLPATLYAYLCLKTASTRRKKVLLWVALGFLAACTYIIRPTALSVFVAILIENVLNYRKSQSLKTLSSVLVCIMLIVGFNNIIKKLNFDTDNNTVKIPYSHWIKMGLNKDTYGVWNTPDVTYPAYVTNTLERDRYNRDIIVERLKDMGFSGYIKHLDEKVEREWVSSQFSMYRVGQWFEQKNKFVSNIVYNYKSIYYPYFALFSYLIKLFLLLGTLAATIFYYKLNKSEAEVVRICLTSTLIVFVFLLLWETAPHYSYEAFALMNIPASLGFYKLFTMFNRRKTR